MKILYVVNDIEYFLAHRARLAREIGAEGHEVIIAAGNHWGKAAPKDMAGLDYTLFDINRQAFSLLGDMKLMHTFSGLIKKHQPDIVHAITIKPILYSAMAAAFLVPARITDSTRFVMTFAGLGKIFENTGGVWQKVRRFLVEKTLKITSSRLDVVATFENSRDRDLLANKGLFKPERCLAVMGAGIDLDAYKVRQRSGSLRVLLASRLINEKGVDTYIAVARRFRNLGIDVEFHLAGAMDRSNPDAVDPEMLARAEADGAIVYRQFVLPADMPGLLAEMDVICLPTRLQEGLPRSLLEAAASGCAMIATDQAACRMIVRSGKTGWLLSKPDEENLYNAVKCAVDDVAETRMMGCRAAKLVRELPVSNRQICNQFLELYQGSSHGR